MHKRILLVEDDMYIALALKIRLQAEGYDVSVVHGTVEAYRVARDNPPDLGQFSADERTASIDKVIMTASKKVDLRDQAIAAGALELFEKPFKSIDLIVFIQTLSDCREQPEFHKAG